MHLTPTGAEELVRLGIKTELDMRGEAIGKVDVTCAEVYGVKRVFIPCVPYGEVFEPENRKSVENFFKTLANPKNYPIYFHCWGGADRTGTFAYILGAFLGMSEKDLILDYEFTSLSVWGTRTRNYIEFKKFLEKFNSLPGLNLQKKGEFFLKNYTNLNSKQINTLYSFLVKQNGL